MTEAEKRLFVEQKLSEPSEYEYQYVAFLDMLGFKSICGEGKLNCSQIKAVFNDIELLKMQFNNFSKLILPEDFYQKTDFTIMSDSIVISAPHSDLGLLFILYLSSIIQNMLLQNGILLRGGIAEGEHFKLDNIMFGPALICAYSIESNMAVYPRIVLSDSIVSSLIEKGVFNKKSVQDYIAKYKNGNENPDDKNDDAVTTQIKLLVTVGSEDSFCFVNQFNTIELMSLSKEKKDKIASVINEGLSNQDNGIIAKYHWLDNHYKKCMSCHQKNIHVCWGGIIHA